VDGGCFGPGFSTPGASGGDADKSSEEVGGAPPEATIQMIVEWVNDGARGGNVGKKTLARQLRHHLSKELSRYSVGDLATIMSINGGGYFDLLRQNGATMSDVFCINPEAADALQVGDTVLVRYYYNDPQMPYIKSIASSDMGVQQGDPGNIDINIPSGTWAQTNGYWWEPCSSIFPMVPLNLVPTTTSQSETFTGPPVVFPSFPGPTQLGDFLGTGVSFQLQNLPPSYQNFAITGISINGTDYSPYFLVWVGPPIGGEAYPNAEAETPVIFLFNIPDTSSSPTGPTFATTSITSLTITYTFQGTGVSYLVQGTPSTGPDTAISPRGITMCEATVGPPDQLGSVLSSVYAPDGGELLTRFYTQFLTFTAGDYGIGLDHAPLTGSLDIGGGSTLADIQVAFQWYSIGSTVYAILGNNASLSSEIDVSYSYAGTTLTPYGDDFTADGTTNQFTLFQPPNPTTTIIDVLVNGTEDSLATFDASTMIVTLSSMPSPGDDVFVDYQSYNVLTQTDTFGASFAYQFSFQLSQTPLTGTITVPAYPGNGFNLSSQTSGTPGTLSFEPLVGSGNVVRFAAQQPVSSDGTSVLNYNYLAAVGVLFHITAGTITEYNLDNPASITLSVPYPIPFDASPISDFLGAFFGSALPIPSAGSRWQTGWNNQRWGFLFYDPTVDGYTVVAPAGIFWRSRKIGNVVGKNWTLLPWPAEDPSNDATIKGWLYPAATGTSTGLWTAGTVDTGVTSNLPRRTAPWMGVSVAARYALQGSWGPTGPNTIVLAPVDFGGGSGAPSDNLFPLRFFLRNSSNQWGLVASVDVRSLVKGNAGVNPLFIPGCGIIHKEGTGGFATGRIGGDPVNSWWPCTRRAAAWLIGVGWCESQWLKDVTTSLNRSNFTAFPVGLNDAGFTLCAVDMAGNTQSQLTFKCDPSGIFNAYHSGDNEVPVNYAVTHGADFLTAGTGVWSGFPLFEMTTNYTASDLWGYLTGYGYCFFYYALNSLDTIPAKPPDFLYPGIPALADGQPRYANTVYGVVGPENNYASQRICLNASDEAILGLSFPYWVRDTDL
jgi:hypothetical protein